MAERERSPRHASIVGTGGTLLSTIHYGLRILNHRLKGEFDGSAAAAAVRLRAAAPGRERFCGGRHMKTIGLVMLTAFGIALASLYGANAAEKSHRVHKHVVHPRVCMTQLCCMKAGGYWYWQPKPHCQMI